MQLHMWSFSFISTQRQGMHSDTSCFVGSANVHEWPVIWLVSSWNMTNHSLYRTQRLLLTHLRIAEPLHCPKHSPQCLVSGRMHHCTPSALFLETPCILGPRYLDLHSWTNNWHFSGHVRITYSTSKMKVVVKIMLEIHKATSFALIIMCLVPNPTVHI